MAEADKVLVEGLRIDAIIGIHPWERRVRQSLSIYSPTDIGEMVTDEGVVTADCQFCGAHYEFDPASLGSGAEE